MKSYVYFGIIGVVFLGTVYYFYRKNHLFNKNVSDMTLEEKKQYLKSHTKDYFEIKNDKNLTELEKRFKLEQFKEKYYGHLSPKEKNELVIVSLNMLQSGEITLRDDVPKPNTWFGGAF